jgi:polar amino acid transport system ATP-binding protein/sulfate transport system ATP-binding protein
MSRSCEWKEALLHLSDVSLTLGGRPVLSHVEATVRNVVRPGLSQGQVVAVLGPSGIGKTQLFRLVAGLQAPDSGQVLVGLKQRPVKRGKVGVVAQNYPLFEHHTVFQNLVLAARCGGHDRDAARSKADELLRRFALQDRRDSYPAILSGGQRQRTAIAQQLLCSNELLLMDEPFSGLDPLMVREVCNLVQEVASLDELFTIVIVTHDIEAALAVADTVWLLGPDRGADGKPSGATIVKTWDLVERGLAWEPDVRALPAFADARKEVEAHFMAR